MKKLLSLPIRHQVAILIALMALLPLGLIVHNSYELYRHEVSEAYAMASTVASRIEDDQNSLVAGATQLAATFSILPAVRKHDGPEASRLLAQILPANPHFFNISIMDRNGMIWASARPLSRQTVSYSDRRFFINAVATGKPAAGEYTVGKTMPEPIFSIGYPIKDSSGSVTDVVVVVIRLDSYSMLYSGDTASPVSAILLTDHKGTILFSSTDKTLIGKQDRADLFRLMTDGGREGSFEAMGILGVRRLYTYRKLTLASESIPYLYIRTGLDKAYVMSAVRRDLLVEATVLLPALLLILGCAFYLSKRGFLDKIQSLRGAIQGIAGGDLTIRTADHVTGGELGELASAFDDMVARVRQAGVDIEESEKRYRELVENANSIILKCDTQGRVTFFNEFAERFFGFSGEEIIGRHVLGTIVPEMDSNGHDLRALVHDLFKNPAAYAHNECESIRKSGERVWISWNNHALLDSDAKYAGILAVGQDITERRRIELEFKKSEQRFRNFVENLNDIVFALTPAGEFSYVSPNWTEVFGYDLAETIGRSFAPFVHPDDVPACMEFLQLVFTTGQKQSGVEYRVLSKDGHYKWYRANASLAQDPVTEAFTLVGVGRDISELKLAEETLRQSEARFSAAFHASPDAISLSRLGNGTFLDVNEGFMAMTGYRRDEVVGRTAIELGLWENHEDRVKLLLELRETGTVTGRMLHFSRRDGTSRTGQMAARIIEIGNEPHILAIIRDVTEQEHLQNELIKAQKLESISVLAGGIAHNFNNVLTGVIGYISYAKKHAGEADKVLETLEAAEKSSYRAAGIARQLMTFSQSGVPVRQPVSVDALLRESLDLFLKGTNVTAVFDCLVRQTIEADSQQISQAFNNIVLNALQAMPEGGKLTVAIEGRVLGKDNRFRLPEGDYVRIDFSDTGCGIPKEDILKVYDPYFTTKESGTGLGLSTCHSIISKHGGHIDIVSEPGMGTTVTVMLPASPHRDDGQRAHDEPVGAEQDDRTLLFMDDEVMIRDLAQNVLSGLGYEVTTCSCGEDAVKLYREGADAGRPFSLAILDLSVPGGMGGIEAARRILDADPYACLVASSGYENDPAIADFRAYGFSGAIAKPYSSDQLAAAIGTALKGHPH